MLIFLVMTKDKIKQLQTISQVWLNVVPLSGVIQVYVFTAVSLDL